jgi:hypothetical protein
VCRGRLRERGIEAQKRPTLVLTASDPDLSHPSRVCPGLGSRLWGGTQYERYDPPMCARTRHGLRWGLVPSLLEAAFYLASLVRPGSPGTSRIVPPLRLIELSPFPRNEGGPRQGAHHQPVLTASGLDLSHLLPACPGLSSRRWRYVARTLVRGVRGVRFVRGAFARVLGFGKVRTWLRAFGSMQGVR